MIITRRALTATLPLTAALVGLSSFHLMADVLANGKSDNLSEPAPLPEMALGPSDAAVTMTEYASITCPHCAAFNANVFPKIKAAYIDTGKIRFVFHEYPLDAVAAASNMLSRCVAEKDSAKYFAITDVLFRQDWPKVTKPKDTLTEVGKQFGLSEQQVAGCLNDEALFNGVVATRAFATNKRGINATPTFLINDDKIVGETPFEEFDRRIKALLKT